MLSNNVPCILVEAGVRGGVASDEATGATFGIETSDPLACLDAFLLLDSREGTYVSFSKLVFTRKEVSKIL